jgi:hypothetical protein
MGLAVTTKRYLHICMSSLLLLMGTCRGQERCGAEVKLLLDPGQAQTAVDRLRAGKPTSGRVYFYDTGALDLLSHGIIFRVRQGRTTDFTVKLRLPAGKEIANTPGTHERYKCEVDRAGDTSFYSYSLQTALAEALPETGSELSRALSPAQKQLLQQAGFAVDWQRVWRSPAIQATAWQAPGKAGLSRLALELWEWPGGKVLELSAKSTADNAPAALVRLQHLVETKGLALSNDQRPKTSLALEDLAHTKRD